jgi:hypothetical protein
MSNNPCRKNIGFDISDNKMSVVLNNPIDLFYESRKNIFDICGNVVNKDKYPFINVLSTYLTDIVDSIDIEVKKSAKNSIINWREKKNPKLLSKMINSDDNINVINRSMNKITASNCMAIVDDITDTLMSDNIRKIPDYSKYLFDSLIKKCISDEIFTKDYINFITSFNEPINCHINQHINKFIQALESLLEKNNSLKEYIFPMYLKEIFQYGSLGIIYSNLFLVQSDKKVEYVIEKTQFNRVFMCCLTNIYNFLDWMPADMDELYARIYMILGIVQTVGDKFIINMLDKDRVFLNDILKQIYSVSNITNKIKLKILDVQDMIKNIEKNKSTTTTSIVTSTANINTKTNINSNSNSNTIEKPVQTLIKTEVNTSKPILKQETIKPIIVEPTVKSVVYNSLSPKTSLEKNNNVEKTNRSSRTDVKNDVRRDKQFNKRNESGYRKDNNKKTTNTQTQTQTQTHTQSNTQTNNYNDNSNKPNIDDDGFIKIERKKNNGGQRKQDQKQSRY